MDGRLIFLHRVWRLRASGRFSESDRPNRSGRAARPRTFTIPKSPEEETRKAGVDVELQNHPLYDAFLEKLQKVQSRKKGEPNPFVVGQANYQKFLDVMSACMQANIDRRKN